MSSEQGIATRRTALSMVDAALRGDSSWTEQAGDLDDRDAAFARRLAFGVLRWYGALDWVSSQLMSRPLKPRDRDIHHLLMLGLLQLWQEDLPRHAAVSATTECARVMGKPWAVGLVNAVLRRFDRERAHWTADSTLEDQRYAHPDWLLDALRHEWPENWENAVLAANHQPPMWLRVHQGRVTVDEAAARLAAAGHETVRHALARDALRLLEPAPVTQLPGFAEGWLSVQDAAAQLAADLVAPAPGMHVLDACAAPGGKTAHLLEREPAAAVTALELSAKRATMINENLGRLGLAAQVLVGDATDPDAWWDGRPFDRILLDAPCSATGVIRRHPEIKWLRDPQQVSAAAALQSRMLDRLWPLVAPGGILVYATCSVLRLENNSQIQAFQERTPDARVIGPVWPEAIDAQPGRQWLPGMSDMDGFYYAALARDV